MLESVWLSCICIYPSVDRTKFDPRARSCIFIGYPTGVKGYKLLDIVTKQVFISRDVVFHENIFPFHSILPSSQLTDPFSYISLPVSLSDSFPDRSPIESSPPIDSIESCPTAPNPPNVSNSAQYAHNMSPTPLTLPNPPIPPNPINPPAPIVSLKRSIRPTKTPSYLT